MANWQSMGNAPRDGSYVELECRYGIAPWYCVARWTGSSWEKPEGGGPFDESSLRWRPYGGKVAEYVDPTGGAQFSDEYWLKASAIRRIF